MSTASIRKSTASVASSTTPERYPRPKSVAASVKSTRSTTSTIRKGPAAGPSGLRTPSGSTRAPSRTPSRAPSRATSTVSTTSENTTAFETAPSELTPSSVGRVRKTSAASTLSTASSRAPGPSASRSPKRPPSVASRTAPSLKDKPVDSVRSTPVAKRTASSTSVSSVKSTTTNATRKSAAKSTTPTPPLPKPAGETKANGKGPESATGEAGGTAKGKSARPAISHEKQESVVSTSSVSTVRDSLKRKGSTDTIREGAAAKVPRGDTLEIGIPCIISSKRTRFRALARYIGEVEGEVGPWVGVEVPMNDAWPGDKLDGRQWHDGTWGGVRYFDIGSSSEWDDYGDTIGRRRRNEWAGSSSKSSLGKREGDQLSIERSKRLRSVSPAVSDMSTSESRGLFVRPQQVLYVVDAVV
ncbi:uncharacterized protein BXZ73DRAFT_108214 [Epithele typhae]|uniref:uncharacterized protein n=1 Tax=Epithele typhae TaxID=378194 RepID=UPI002008C97F|nr:uncharacterized protein BXZ73DRAFT_108214 [Epithele typhae]KAH9911139.1 hypothetical protein BXZ73DRAFT_108214 [Epithele typhae]